MGNGDRLMIVFLIPVCIVPVIHHVIVSMVHVVILMIHVPIAHVDDFVAHERVVHEDITVPERVVPVLGSGIFVHDKSDE
jgi:hypothetical protein